MKIGTKKVVGNIEGRISTVEKGKGLLNDLNLSEGKAMRVWVSKRRELR